MCVCVHLYNDDDNDDDDDDDDVYKYILLLWGIFYLCRTTIYSYLFFQLNSIAAIIIIVRIQN